LKLLSGLETIRAERGPTAESGSLRILFATNHAYLPQRAGGSESSTHELCLDLAGSGQAVGVLAAIQPSGLLGARHWLQRRLLRRHAFPHDNSMGYPVFRGWQPGRGIDEVLARFRPDAVIVQAGQPMLLAGAFVERGVPCVVYLHDVLFDDLGGLPRASQNPVYLANSQFTAGRARAAFGIQPQVIPPLVRRERYETPTTRRTVVLVNPDPMKGGDLALELAGRRPDIPFEFVECWPSNRLLVDYQRRARAAGNVTWRRRVADMRTIYRSARIVLVPSRVEEAWGRVVTEAHTSGIPALASHVGGLPESVGPGGVLVAPDASLDRWAEALSEIWDRPLEYERLSQAALEHSLRPEIRPDTIVRAFLAFVGRHAERLRD